jgi:AGCS family alanine or glycine:cation symporter
LFWTTTEALNALMALPNVIALVLLSATVFRLTKSYGFRPG